MNLKGTIIMFVITVCIAYSPANAGNTQRSQKVAVLSLYVKTRTDGHRMAKTVDHMYVLYLTNTVRMAVGRSLPASEFIVYTNETINELLPPATELADCQGECAVDVGRTLEVDYVFTGEILYVQGEHRLQLMVYECHSGSLIDGRTTGSVSSEGVSDVEREIEYAVESLCKGVEENVVRRQEAYHQSLLPSRSRYEFSVLLGASWPPPRYLTSTGFETKSDLGTEQYAGDFFASNYVGFSYTLSAGVRFYSDPIYIIPGITFNSNKFWPSNDFLGTVTAVDPDADITVEFLTLGASVKLLATGAEFDTGGVYFEFLVGRYELLTETVFLAETKKFKEAGGFFGFGIGGRVPVSNRLAADVQIASHFARPDLVKFILSAGLNVSVGEY